MLYGDGPFGDIWIDDAIAPDLRRKVIEEALRFYKFHRQVFDAYDGRELAWPSITDAQPDTWTVLERVRASYNREVSGDIVVVLKPQVTPISDPTGGYVATHGSAWDYDRRVPILFWRKGLAGFEQPLAVETVDIMPTLAALLDLVVPASEIDGRCLDLDAGARNTCFIASRTP